MSSGVYWIMKIRQNSIYIVILSMQIWKKENLNNIFGFHMIINSHDI